MLEDAESFLGVEPETEIGVRSSATPPPLPSTPDSARECRAKLLAKGYYVMLGVAALFGLLSGVMIRSKGGTAADPIAVITLFILFPAFILTDSALRAQLLSCPLRAASIPLVEGFVIWQVSNWRDPMAISLITAIIYAVVSFIVAAIARAKRR